MGWFGLLIGKEYRRGKRIERHPSEPVLISHDLETARFHLRSSDGRGRQVLVDVAALAEREEVPVRTAEEARRLVFSRLHDLEFSALRAVGRGRVSGDRVILEVKGLPTS